MYMLHRTELMYILHRTELMYMLHRTEYVHVAQNTVAQNRIDVHVAQNRTHVHVAAWLTSNVALKWHQQCARLGHKQKVSSIAVAYQYQGRWTGQHAVLSMQECWQGCGEHEYSVACILESYKAASVLQVNCLCFLQSAQPSLPVVPAQEVVTSGVRPGVRQSVQHGENVYIWIICLTAIDVHFCRVVASLCRLVKPEVLVTTMQAL